MCVREKVRKGERARGARDLPQRLNPRLVELVFLLERCPVFRISGLEFRVSGFEFRFSGFGF